MLPWRMPVFSAHVFHDANDGVDPVQAFGSRSQHSSSQVEKLSRAAK
jgi:hypothetical protein